MVIAVGYGQVPWVALTLAVTFGIYGLVKKQVGGRVSPLVGLTVETMLLTPFALAFLVWLQATGTSNYLAHGPALTIGLALAGVITAIPLLLFAAASSRIPLSMMGLIQYLTPTIQFAIGVWVNHEVMPPPRWIGFGLVWVALVAAHRRQPARRPPSDRDRPRDHGLSRSAPQPVEHLRHHLLDGQRVGQRHDRALGEPGSEALGHVRELVAVADAGLGEGRAPAAPHRAGAPTVGRPDGTAASPPPTPSFPRRPGVPGRER